jgi:hypothetical protein
MDSNPADLLSGGFCLSDMQARSDRDAKLAHCRDDCSGGVNRLSRLIKRCEEAVSGGIDLSTTEPLELPANGSVVRRDQPLPCPVAKPDGQVSRAHYIRE